MPIRDLFVRDLGRKIEGVVKVYDYASLAQEIREFVLTDWTEEKLKNILDTFTESLDARRKRAQPMDDMGIWLSGFFGSGKSHFAKLVGYLLQNHAVDADGARRPPIADRRLALFLIQTQTNRGSGRIIPLGSLSGAMKEAIKTADAYLKANLKNLGIERQPKEYDFSVQAINLNQAKEGSEMAVAFFVSMVSALLEKPVLEQTVVLGEMSVQGMLLKVNGLPERMQLAVEAGAKRILIPSENKRDVAEVPDAVLTKIQWQFYDSPTRAVIMGLGLG